MTNNPLISVLVSTYNSIEFIEGKIKDLIDQTIFERIEIIIINSGSLQNEDEVIRKYLKIYSNIKYIFTEERESIYKAWNRGIKLSSGEFITNANTDDRLKNDAFEILSSVLQDKPDVALVYGDQYITSISNQSFVEAELNSRSKAYSSPDYNYFNQLDRGLVFSQPMWRASLHSKDNIWFNEDYEICGDYEFQLKISQKYKLFHISKLLGTFYLSPQRRNKSYNNLKNVIIERQKISEPYIRDYILNCKNDYLIEIINKKLKTYTNLPIPVFYLIKRFRLLINNSLVYNKYFYTIEFAYFFSILTFLKLGHKNKAIKLSKKILKYSYSERIDIEKRKLLKEFLGKIT